MSTGTLTNRRRAAAIALRWSARASSLASVGLLSMFLLGDEAKLGTVTPAEALMLCCFPVGLAVGLLLAWFREGLGGAVAVASVAAFYAVHLAVSGRLPGGPWFLIFSLPAPLFLASSAVRRRAIDPAEHL